MIVTCGGVLFEEPAGRFMDARQYRPVRSARDKKGGLHAFPIIASFGRERLQATHQHGIIMNTNTELVSVAP